MKWKWSAEQNERPQKRLGLQKDRKVKHQAQDVFVGAIVGLREFLQCDEITATVGSTLQMIREEEDCGMWFGFSHTAQGYMVC